jgi:hypothetical protein
MPTLITLSTNDPDPKVRRKAVYAISSAVRNYQPAMDELIRYLPFDDAGEDRVDAGDMGAIDIIMERLREYQPVSA